MHLAISFVSLSFILWRGTPVTAPNPNPLLEAQSSAHELIPLLQPVSKSPAGSYSVPARATTAHDDGIPDSHVIARENNHLQVLVPDSNPTLGHPDGSVYAGSTCSAIESRLRAHSFSQNECNENHPGNPTPIEMENSSIGEIEQLESTSGMSQSIINALGAIEAHLFSNDDDENPSDSPILTAIETSYDGIQQLGSSSSMHDPQSTWSTREPTTIFSFAGNEDIENHSDSSSHIAVEKSIERSVGEIRQLGSTSQAGNIASGIINIESSEREEEAKWAIIHQLLSSHIHTTLLSEPYFMSNLHLHEHYERFVERASLFKSRGAIPHSRLFQFYRRLITTIYHLHRIVLNKLEISTFVQYSQQTKLLEWLEEQIIGCKDGPPVLGLSNLNGAEKDKLGPAKIRLINYFARIPASRKVTSAEIQLVASNAYDLMKMFTDQDEFNYSLSGHSSHIVKDSNFEERMFNLRQMTQGIIDHEGKLIKGRRRPAVSTFDSTLKAVVAQLFLTEDFGSNMGGSYLSSHPTLPILMYFMTHQPGLGQLRVVYKQDGKPVQMLYLKMAFEKLARATSMLHIEALQRFNIHDKGELNEQRYKILGWLRGLLLRGQNILPTIGLVKLEGNLKLAPWEDVSNAGIELFTPIQLNLIEYLSEKSMNLESLHEHATYLLTTWYRDHLPEKYEYLAIKPSPSENSKSDSTRATGQIGHPRKRKLDLLLPFNDKNFEM